MIASKLPKKFWSNIVQTVVSITNRTPTRVILYNSVKWPKELKSPYNTPYSAFTGAPPQVFHSGSDVYVHRHGSVKPTDKLDARGKPYKLIGFTGIRIYRVWHPESNKIISTTDIRFPPKSESTAEKQKTKSVQMADPTETCIKVEPQLLPDGDVPIRGLDDSQLLRPAKSFALVARNPYACIKGLPTSYKDAVNRTGDEGKWWLKSMQRGNGGQRTDQTATYARILQPRRNSGIQGQSGGSTGHVNRRQ